MTIPHRKKLIEVALPLKAINEASAREKSIRHGHPSTLHLWWARRPLAACRAVLFASLVDDPDSDPVYRRADGTVDEERAGIKRAELFNLIEELVQWENSTNPRVINAARAEIARCVASRKIELGELAKEAIIFGGRKGQKHPKGAVSGEGVTAWDVLTTKAKPEIVNAFLAEHAPPILDPFCGGGSIPLEAQRLGLRAYASDLNPVPVLITKALIEIPPKFSGRPPVHPPEKNEQARSTSQWHGAEGLAEDVRYYGKWMRDEAEKRMGQLYPKTRVTAAMARGRADLAKYIGRELTVIAWIWARTTPCTNPACGQSVPLVSDPGLCKRPRRWYSLRWERARGAASAAEWSVVAEKADPKFSTIGRRGATCPSCGSPIALDDIRDAGQKGKLGRQLMTVVAAGDRERVYLPGGAIDLPRVPSTSPDLLNSALPEKALGFRVQNYGIRRHRDLFTDRQLLLLDTLCQASQGAFDLAKRDSADDDYARAIAVYLALGIGRVANRHASQSFYNPNRETVEQVFARNALPMIWVYAEANPFSDSSGNVDGQFEYLYHALAAVPAAAPGVVEQRDARVPWTNDAPVVSTDPPYYDNVPYADLSDFFYVWHRRALSGLFPQLYSTLLTPKQMELIAEPARHESADQAKQFFEDGLRAVFTGISKSANREIPVTVYYAFKQEEDDEEARTSSGWDTILQGIVDSGWTVTGTWPMRTEQPGGLREHGRNSLASSIVLVCRLRSSTAAMTTRRDFLTALRSELPSALKALQHGNVAPVDLAQAVIGPGMAVFTRYARVIESDGTPMTVRTALGIINQVLDEVLAEQEGDFDPDTRWALAWFEQYGTNEDSFGVAETLSKAKNTAVNGLVEAGIVKARGGKVRLVTRAELSDDWSPSTDNRLTAWETTQHLIRTLENKGEAEAARLLASLGGMGEIARELAYRLHSISSRKKWPDEERAYNGLVIAWPELSKLALSSRVRQPESQRELF
ncbi:MAG: hypothetical protein BroJett003_01330 [Planctomycetota bacterium]|nr:MAG: hypothetical protein BroJett003_01330 [Planctomycetota bacterium]